MNYLSSIATEMIKLHDFFRYEALDINDALSMYHLHVSSIDEHFEKFESN